MCVGKLAWFIVSKNYLSDTLASLLKLLIRQLQFIVGVHFGITNASKPVLNRASRLGL